MATETPKEVGRAGGVIDQPRRQHSPGLAAAAAIAGLLLLVLAGWVAWNQGALVGLRWVEFDSPLALAAFGFVAGIGAFFAPCAFALFPGYISYYLTSVGTGRETAGRSLALGLTCAAGSALFFAAAGVAITLVGGVISPYLIATKPVIALAVSLLGFALVADVRLPSFGLPLGRVGQKLPPAGGLFLYGFGYALASTGCTLPIYVSIIVLPLTSGFSGAALLTFASFASAMAVMMLLTSLLVGLAKASLLRRLQASTVWIKRVSGFVLTAAGLYLGYYYIAAGM
jgi:cytochrome c-type biogenesis protein